MIIIPFEFMHYTYNYSQLIKRMSFFTSRTVTHWCRGSHCRLIVPYSLEKNVRALPDREKSGLLGKCNPAFLSSLRGLFIFCSSLCWQFRLVSWEYSLVTPSPLLRSNRGPYNDPVIDCRCETTWNKLYYRHLCIC